MLAVLRSRLTYANVIATLALFLALSGGAYALTITGRNVANGSLTGTDVKNNSLTGADVTRLTGNDIKNDTLLGSDVKDNTLTGADINESTLTLPSVRVPLKVATATGGPSADAARSAAPEVPLYSSGPFTIYGKCFTDQSTAPDTVSAQTYIRTTENGSVYEGDVDTLDGSIATGYLNTATGETDREVTGQSVGADNQALANFDAQAEFAAVAPSGAAISGQMFAAAKQGTPPGGNGAYGDGNRCIFLGSVATS